MSHLNCKIASIAVNLAAEHFHCRVQNKELQPNKALTLEVYSFDDFRLRACLRLSPSPLFADPPPLDS